MNQKTEIMKKQIPTPMKVFIVDDSLIVRARIVTMLSELESVEVVGHAQSSKEAAAAIPAIKPDVVILDIHMPGGNGIELLRHLKSFSPSPLVIMFTNFPFAQVRKECTLAGADYFFDKSRDFEKVAQVLGSLAERN